ncbi:MAG: ribonuclease HI family protein [Microgenomates group bacterium]
MKLLLNTDGGSRGNPGPAAYGYVIQDITHLEAGLTRGSHQADAVIILEKCGKYIGVTTNNIAEYEALVHGVKWVVENEPNAELVIKMDSLLIVNQIKGLFKVKNPGLLPKYQEVRGLLAKLPKWSIDHTYREGNSVADALVNEALDHIKRDSA